jgi:hypothetical protein
MIGLDNLLYIQAYKELKMSRKYLVTWLIFGLAKQNSKFKTKFEG